MYYLYKLIRSILSVQRESYGGYVVPELDNMWDMIGFQLVRHYVTHCSVAVG